MRDALEQLGRMLADYQSALILFVTGCVFVLIFAITCYVGGLIRGREEIRRRALEAEPYDAEMPGDRRSLRHQRFAGTGRLLSSVASTMVPDDAESVSSIRKELMQAGFFQPSTVATYYFLRVILAALLPVAAFMAVKLDVIDLSTTGLLGMLVVSGMAGLMLPRMYVGYRRKQLQQQCRNGFPDFMDLMVVCAEAGISMGAAIQRVARELAPPYPYLGACLHLASLELRAGRSLTDSFERLADRVGIEEAHNLGSLLKQSAELGTSLSDALRVYSEEMRDKRMSRAEEKAHALPAKMAVPLTMFVFPVIMVVILLPVFVRVSNM